MTRDAIEIIETIETTETTVKILGKQYRIKCPDKDIASLQHAADYVDEKMRALCEASKSWNLEQIAVITALNIAHQLLNLEEKQNLQLHVINQRLCELQDKVEHALVKPTQLELSSAESE